MKTTQRVWVGLVSSLLLSAGLTRAAEKTDPLSQQLTTGETLSERSLAPSVACALPCYYMPRPTMVPPSQLR